MKSNQKLTEESIDIIVEMIQEGNTLTAIAAYLKVAVSTLIEYINKDTARSVRAREARENAAAVYVDEAENNIRIASDPFELAKAKELAHHLRWKAAKMSPKNFGDKIEVDNKGEVGLTVKVVKFADKDDDNEK